MNHYNGIEIDGEAMKAVLSTILSEEVPAEAAVLEWLKDQIDLGPDANLSGKTHRKAWEAYCNEKGNCEHREFDEPLWRAFDAARAKLTDYMGDNEIDAINEMENEFGDVLRECHN